MAKNGFIAELAAISRSVLPGLICIGQPSLADPVQNKRRPFRFRSGESIFVGPTLGIWKLSAPLAENLAGLDEKEGSMGNRNHSAISIKSQLSSIIEDTYLLAALLTFDPTIRYTPFKDENGNVAFEVHGRIADKMGRLYAGESASLKTYISNLKTLRSKIFALKHTAGLEEKHGRKALSNDR